MLKRLRPMQQSNFSSYSSYLRARVRECGYVVEKPDGKRSYRYVEFEQNLRAAIAQQHPINQQLPLNERILVQPSKFGNRAGRLVEEALGK